MAKKVLMIFLFVLFIVFLGGILVMIMKPKSPDVGTFDVSEYQSYIESCSSEENLGNISDSKDLLKKVEAIWIKKYGERIKKQKPYQVFYDKDNDIWLVSGTLRFHVMGGVAHILVEDDTGKVLAIWHDK